MSGQIGVASSDDLTVVEMENTKETQVGIRLELESELSEADKMVDERVLSWDGLVADLMVFLKVESMVSWSDIARVGKLAVLRVSTMEPVMDVSSVEVMEPIEAALWGGNMGV